jgi:hypothetical protein
VKYDIVFLQGEWTGIPSGVPARQLELSSLRSQLGQDGGGDCGGWLSGHRQVRCGDVMRCEVSAKCLLILRHNTKYSSPCSLSFVSGSLYFPCICFLRVQGTGTLASSPGGSTRTRRGTWGSELLDHLQLPRAAVLGYSSGMWCPCHVMSCSDDTPAVHTYIHTYTCAERCTNEHWCVCVCVMCLLTAKRLFSLPHFPTMIRDVCDSTPLLCCMLVGWFICLSV